MKISKDIRRRIAKLAKDLERSSPGLVYKNRTAQVVVHGSTLIDNGVAKGVGFSTISPNKRYLGPSQPLPVNHRKEIEKAWIAGGTVGIIAYVNRIEEVSASNSPAA